jgi:hypothetical protein
LTVRRKGELSKGRIDREWPHQVALPASFVNGKNYMILHRFCRGLSVLDRHQGFRRANEEWIVYCFKERSDAEYFHMHFPNGEFVKPEERPRWPGKR